MRRPQGDGYRVRSRAAFEIRREWTKRKRQPLLTAAFSCWRFA